MDVYSYHHRSKHRFDGYARGPETIDWDRQPDPVRRFEGAPLTELPLFRGDKTATFQSLDLNSAFETQSGMASPVTLETVALLLEYSLSLSAWKQYGTARWALRCNPSSGNLHPTEAYLILLGLSEVEDGVYHYRADRHGLEQRCRFQESIPVASPQVFIGLSSVHWREAWKYGERAYRYCQLDVGHAIGSLSFAAALNGWSLRPLTPGTKQLAQLLGTDREEAFIAHETEWSDCLLQLQTAGSENLIAIDQLVSAASAGHWQGRAAVLDRRHFYDWPVIDEIAAVCAKSSTASKEGSAANRLAIDIPNPMSGDYLESLPALILRRRSAQAFDGQTAISSQQFFVMLDHLLPRRMPPWEALPVDSSLHCVFFVHRVSGLKPGLYALPRTLQGEQVMREQMREQFLWERVADAPAHLPLYLLLSAKAERTAAKLSCQQSIAGDSAFSMTMLAEFDAAVAEGAWRYPRLYWEAGALGQALYLEAEGIGCQGTGIGCYFDDGVHELLGIQSTALQSLYHFTVGGALRDERIASFSPYRERGG